MRDYLYLLPLLLGLLFLIVYFIDRTKIYKTDVFDFFRNRKIINTLNIISCIIPKDSKLYTFYSNRILNYTSLKVERLIEIKVLLFIFTMIFMMLVKYTNISIQTKEIFNNFDYRMDLIYSYKNVIDPQGAFKQEMQAFEKALKKIKKTDLNLSSEEVQFKIRSLINVTESEILIPVDSLVNKVFYRILDYYKVREIRISRYVLMAFCFSLIPEIYFIIFNLFVKEDVRKEIKFLKKLVIMNGNIKPVDFREVLDGLIDKSVYYRAALLNIKDENRKNSVNNEEIYSKLIRKSKNIEEKLFLEKLNEANNYDFDLAIQNIQNEFRLEKREEVRRVKKRIETIHIMGITGFMFIIIVFIMYLIMPWMKMFDMNGLGF